MQVLVIYDKKSTFTNAVYDHLQAISNMQEYNVSFYDINDLNDNDLLFKFLKSIRNKIIIVHYTVRLPYGMVSNNLIELTRSALINAIMLQDEYDSTKRTILELQNINPQIVFTVTPQNSIRKIYPEESFPNTKFVNILTGYVPENLRDLDNLPATTSRTIHLGYRGRELPLRYGAMGYDKEFIGNIVAAQRPPNLKFDISSNDQDRIYGNDWINFLTTCKAFLGTESGFNIIDWDGDLEERIIRLRAINNFSDDMIRNLFTSQLEIPNLMNQISPKIFEIACTRTVPVLLEGEYSGVLRANHNYISIKKDYSNLNEVFDKLENNDLLARISENNIRDIVNNHKLSYAAMTEIIEASLNEVLLNVKGAEDTEGEALNLLKGQLQRTEISVTEKYDERKIKNLLLLTFYDPDGISTVKEINEELVKFFEDDGIDVEVINFYEISRKYGNFTIPNGIDSANYEALLIHNALSYDPKTLVKVDEENHSLIKGFKGRKVVLRQDDNHQLSLFQRLCLDLQIHTVFSVVPESSIKEFYSSSFLSMIDVQHMFTGYISEKHVALIADHKLPIHDRPIDISYRGSRQPLVLGRGAWEKEDIYNQFNDPKVKKKLNDFNFNIDISCDWEDRKTSNDWYDFLANSKVVLATESGGTIFEDSVIVAESHEEMKFWCENQDTAGLLSGSDHLENGNNFRQIAPRHIEAAIMGCAQVMYRGSYSGIFEPWTDYIPLDKDLSNIDEVLSAITDNDRLSTIAENSLKKILSIRELRIQTLFQKIINSLSAKQNFEKTHDENIDFFGINLCNHHPNLDPRISWLSNGMSSRCQIINCGFEVANDNIPFSKIKVWWTDSSGFEFATYELDLKPVVAAYCSVTEASFDESNWFHYMNQTIINHEFNSRFAPATSEMQHIATFWMDKMSSASSPEERWYANYFIFCIVGLNVVLGAIPIAPSFIVATDLPTIPSAKLFAQRLNRNCLVELHEWWPLMLAPQKPGDLGASTYDNVVKYQANLLEGVNAVSTVSPGLVDKLDKSGVDTRRLFLLPNCEPKTESDYAYGIEPTLKQVYKEKVIFIFQGAYAKRRGIERLIAAMALVPENCLLVIRIPNNSDNIIAQLQDFAYETLGISSDKIIFRPAVSEKNLVAMCRYADCGIIPYEKSEYLDACPNKLSQYCKAGLAVISSETSYASELITKHNFGLVYNDKSVADMAEKITKVAKDKKIRKRMQTNASQFYLNHFNWGKFSKPIYEQIINNAVQNHNGLVSAVKNIKKVEGLSVRDTDFPVLENTDGKSEYSIKLDETPLPVRTIDLKYRIFYRMPITIRPIILRTYKFFIRK